MFGGVPFFIIFNVLTAAWVFEGKTNPHFFDPFPCNFYTFTVSWLAINMSALILFSDLRKRVKEEEDERHKRMMLESLLRLTESMKAILEDRKES